MHASPGRTRSTGVVEALVRVPRAGSGWHVDEHRYACSVMSFPATPVPAAAAHPGDAGPGPRDEAPRRRPDHAAVLQGRHRRTGGDLVDAGPVPALARVAAQGSRRHRRDGRASVHALRRAGDEGRRGVRGLEPRRHRSARDRRSPRGARRRRGRDQRPLPRRVHRSRSLRRARRRGTRSTTTRRSSDTDGSPWRRPRRGRTWSGPAA